MGLRGTGIKQNRSTRGVLRETFSKSGALQRIGITLAKIVIHRQTVDQGFSDIRNSSFAQFASGGFPNISSESTGRSKVSRRRSSCTQQKAF